MTNGFSGCFSHRSAQIEDLGALARQSRRGEDSSGHCWSNPEAGVAFVSWPQSGVTCTEPLLKSKSERYVLLFRGRIQNRFDLRQELERAGVPIHGASDGALALATFEAWGSTDAVRRLVGSFSIALWDAENRRLSLVRDRLGIEPLFVYQRAGSIAFASELKLLLAMPGVEQELDPDSLADYLRHLHIPAPNTLFRGVSKIMPGHILTVSDPGQPLQGGAAYWSLPAVAREGIDRPFSGSDSDAVMVLDRMLEESIRGHIPTNGSLGAFLSGGIDSTTVVAVAQGQLGRRLPTFSVGFDDEDYNEALYAAKVAAYLQTSHTELVLTDQDVRAVIPELPEINDQPIGNPAQIPLYLACRFAGGDVATALSGEGGDELFAGYNRYVFGERIIRRTARLPRVLRLGVAAGIEALGPSAWDRLFHVIPSARPAAARQHGWGERLYKIASLLRRDTQPQMYRSLLSAWQEPEHLVAGVGERLHDPSASMADESFSLLDRMLLYDQGAYLPDEALAKVARVERATRMEIGMPLLDHRIVEFSWRLPREMKLRDGCTKWILRQVLYHRIPRELVERPKMGFSVPIARWLRSGLRPLAEELLSAERLGQSGFLRPAPIQRAWKDFLCGQSSEALGLWAILMFQMWWEHWCQARQPVEVLR